MKSLIVLTVLLSAVAISQQAPVDQTVGNAGAVLAESLLKRAEALQTRAKSVQQHVGRAYAHLMHDLDHQTVVLEALVLDLKKHLADPNIAQQLHHLHVIEEDLLYLENRISEEIAIIADVGHNPVPGNQSGSQLIARAEKLIKDAKEAAAKYPNARETQDIEREIIVTQALVKAIQAQPALAQADLRKNEEELVRHEKTLQQLIEKASTRKQ